MKKLSKNLVRGFLAATLFTGTTVLLSTAGIPAINQAHADATYQQVHDYLTGEGYYVILQQAITKYPTQDWIAHTTKGQAEYKTTIHVSGTSIIGHEDVVW